MRVLLINQTFYPDLSATANHLTQFALDLAKQGVDVTVMTGKKGYVEPYREFPRKEHYQGIFIKRIGFSFLGREGRLRRVINTFILNLIFAWNLLWIGKYDRIVALTSPPLVGAVALFFSRFRKIPFVYWIMDLNPDQAIQVGWIKPDSGRAHLLNKVLKYTLEGADEVVVLDEFMKKRVLSKVPHIKKIHIIPPWVDDGDLCEATLSSTVFRHKHRLKEKFVVMYSGNHSICHPLNTLLDAALRLQDNDQVVFVFIGAGNRVRDVLEFREQHKLHNIIQLPYQPQEDLSDVLSAANLHLVVMGEGLAGILHPCKIYSILRVGRPFVYIGPDEGPLATLVKSEGVGIQINHGEDQQLVKIIEQQINGNKDHESNLTEKRKLVSAQYFRERWTWSLVNIVTGASTAIKESA